MRTSLRAEGYRVMEVANAAEAISQAASHVPDLVLLDLGLPDRDGMEVLVAIREWCACPIIVVSARGRERSKVEALDAGADDYLTKPFGAAELLARIRVAFRHRASRTDSPADPAFSVRDLYVDLTTRRVSLCGEAIHLTPIEYRLISTMVLHAGKVLTHRYLLNEVWGPEASLRHNTCAFSWRISGARSSRTPPDRSLS